MAHDVFISYSHHDKAAADAVCATLEACGVRCWIAPRDVLAGAEWAEAIIDAMNEARVVVLVFSSHSNESQQVRNEIERAVSKGVPILPFRIESVLPSKKLELFLSAVHWLDALTEPMERHLENLAGTVTLLLDRLEPADAKMSPAPPFPVPPPSPATTAASESPDLAETRVRAGVSAPAQENNRGRSSLLAVYTAGLILAVAGAAWVVRHGPASHESAPVVPVNRLVRATTAAPAGHAGPGDSPATSWLLAKADEVKKANALSDSASVLVANGQAAKALPLFRQALAMMKDSGDVTGQGLTLTSMGIAYDALHDPRQSQEYLQQGLETSRQAKDTAGEAYALENLGTVSLEMRQPRKALEYLQEALPLATAAGNPTTQADILRATASAYDQTGDHQEAGDLRKRAQMLKS